MTDLEAIARGLSKAGREMLPKMSDGWIAAFALRPDYSGRRAAGDLRPMVSAGLVETRMGGAQCNNYRLTPLGLALHRHILAQEQQP